MTAPTDPKVIAEQLCQFARANFVAEGMEFNEHTPLANAGIDSFALVELTLYSERVLGVRVPDSHLTSKHLASMASLAACIAELARARNSAPTIPPGSPAPTPEPAKARNAPPPEAQPPAAKTDLPRQVRLAPGDCFMHGQDRQMRQMGLPGNVCHAVLRLEAGLDVDLLRRRVAGSPILNWLARVHIVRPFGMLAPVWRAAAPPRPFLHEHDEPGLAEDKPTALPDYIPGSDLRPDRGPALALNLVRHPDQTSRLVLSWNHTLLDAPGAELLLRHLSGNGASNGGPAGEYLLDPNPEGRTPAGWWSNVKNARGCVQWLNASGREPLFSLLPVPRRAGPLHNQHRLISFKDQEAAHIEGRFAQLSAGFRRSHFYLAAAMRAMHTVATGRGNKHGAYLVPVPHDMRRWGSNGPIMSNNLSILFYRIEPKLAASLGAILAELSRQMTEQIRTRFPESCMAALDMFKPLPLDFFVRHLGKPTRGKFATFCFSDSGETCAGMTEFLGARIRDVTHVVPSWRPPGLTVVFLSFGGRPSVQIGWVDDCLSLAEVEAFERSLRRALLEEDIV